MQRTLVIANLGTPETATEEGVREFLGEFLGDPMVVEYPRWLWLPILERIILRKRPARIARLYQSIWSEGGSPLRVQTEKLVKALSQEVPEGWKVVSAYRYGRPSIANRVAEGLRDGGEVYFTSLFPQRTASSSGSAEAEALRVARKFGAADRLHLRPLPATDADYIGALAEGVNQQLAVLPAKPDHLLVSFHSIPQAVDRREKGLYRIDCKATFEGLLAKLEWDPAKATLAYQSVFGPAKWIGPSTAATLAELPSKGVRSLLVTMPGFLTDGLETLEEIAVEGRSTFLGAGGSTYATVPAIADEPTLRRALLRIAAVE
ncbi:MAG: ferrochelatase [Planctomycetota bacterium]